MKHFKRFTATAILLGITAFSSTCVFADNAVLDCPPPEIPQVVADESIAVQGSSDETISIYSDDNEAYPIDENGHTKQIKTSYNTDNQYVFTIDESTIHFTGKDGSSYTYFWPQLRVDSSNKLTQLIFAEATDGTLSCDINFSSVDDGTYSLCVYGNTVMNGSYSAIIYNQITFVKDGDDSYFLIDEDIYNNNVDFIERNYRLPVYYLTQIFPTNSTQWVYVNDTIKGWAEEITSGLDSDYEKIKAVHDWAANNIYYDYDYLYERNTSTPLTPEEVYNNKYSICQGYADLSASLLRSIGIPCKVVEGYAKSNTTAWSSLTITSANHAWNEAWLEDEQRWVIFDATWDSGNKKGYETEGECVAGTAKSTYFDISQHLFSGNHKVMDCARVLYTSLGDVSNDSSVDSSDTAAFLKHFSGIEALADSRLTTSIADVNGDEEISFTDVIATAKKIVFNEKV